MVVIIIRHICLLTQHEAGNVARRYEWWCIISGAVAVTVCETTLGHALQTIHRAL